MHKILAVTLLVIQLTWRANAATNIEYRVDFSNYTSATNNDLVNQFGSASSLFFQSRTAGLFGSGGIIPPDRMDTYLNFKQSVAVERGTKLTVAIDFYFDPLAVNPDSDYVPIQLYLEGSRGVQFDILKNRGNPEPKLRIAYSFKEPKLSAVIPFDKKAWYKLTGELTFNGGNQGDDVISGARLELINEPGPLTPVAVIQDAVSDYTLARSKPFQGQIRATRWGGCVALDNFLLSTTTRSDNFISLSPRLTFSMLIDTRIGASVRVERAKFVNGPWEDAEIIVISKQPQLWIDQNPLSDYKLYRAVLLQ